MATLTGNKYRNTLTGTALDDLIDGREDNDTLYGGGGNDTLYGGSGSDIVYGGDGNDTIYGGTGGDTLRGDGGDDTFVLASGDGTDDVKGGSGYDRIVAAVAGTVLTLKSGFGAANGVEEIVGGMGVTLKGTSYGDTYDFAATTLTNIQSIDLGDGSDTFVGSAGADRVLGGSGSDRLDGGAGADTLTGGSGNDTFVVSTLAGGADRITDYSSSYDRIELAVLAGRGVTGASLASFVQAQRIGADTVLRVDTDGAAGGAGFADAAILQGYQGSSVKLRIDGATYTVAPLTNVPPAVPDQAFSIAENSANGTVVGTILATDPDPGDTRTFALIGGTGMGAFAVDAATGAISVTNQATLDYEATPSLTLDVRVTDAQGLSDTATVTIDLTDAADSPTDIQISNATFPENAAGMVIGVLSTSDPDSPASGLAGPFTYSFAPPQYGWHFQIVGNELRVGATGLDHEVAATRAVTVRATDAAGAYFDKTFFLSVIDVNEAPIGVSIQGWNAIAENQPNAWLGPLFGYDPDTATSGFGAPFTFSIVPGADGAQFQIVNNELWGGPIGVDYEAGATRTVIIRVTDSGGLSVDRALPITVYDTNDAPNDIMLAGAGPVSENTPGMLVGALTATDPDAQSMYRRPLTFSLLPGGDASEFTLVGNKLYVGAGGLDYEAGATRSVVVRVSETGGGYFDETLTIDVADVDETPPTVNLALLDGSNGFRLVGPVQWDYAGVEAKTAGDVNGDGLDDVMTTVYLPDPVGGWENQTVVIFGASGGFASDIDLGSVSAPDGFRIADSTGSEYGAILAIGAAGDVNADGIDDILLGGGYGASGAAAAYVVYGRSGGFGASIDVGALDGSDGFVMVGEGDFILASVVNGAGDINADGADDLIVGAQLASGEFLGPVNSFVVFGDADSLPPVVDLSQLDGNTGFWITGGEGNDGILSVSAAGDINADGIDDIVVGDLGEPFAANSGATCVVFGKAGGFAPTIDVSNLDGANGFRVTGTDGSHVTITSVSAAGDINADGIEDLVLGASGAGSGAGAAYIVFGSATPFGPTLDIEALDGTNGFRLDGVRGGAGWMVGAAGDINGDSIADMIVGAPHADSNVVDGGAAYILFGRTGGFPASLSVATLVDAEGLRLGGLAPGDSTGLSGGGAGDMNGDGFDDVIVSAPGADPNGFSSGSIYVVFGNDFSGLVSHLGTPDADLLWGSVSADVMIGGRGDDDLVGNEGNDVLKGAAGDDWIAGEEGDDRLVGGRGDDTFYFWDGSGDDAIVDFTPGSSPGAEADHIYVPSFGFADFAALLNATTEVAGSAVIQLDADDSVTLLGVRRAALTESDFSLVFEASGP